MKGNIWVQVKLQSDWETVSKLFTAQLDCSCLKQRTWKESALESVLPDYPSCVA